MSDQRARQLEALETDAEVLVTHQLDLVAQLERQLRAVHHTMRRIEQLRGAKRRRAGSVTLSNEARDHTLEHLTGELASIDAELDPQHELCLEMQTSVDKMRARLRARRRASISGPPSNDPGSSPSRQAERATRRTVSTGEGWKAIRTGVAWVACGRRHAETVLADRR
jgi:hypothetical protein